MEHKIQDLFEFIRNGANIKQGEPGGYPITRIETISSGEINRNKMGYAGLTDLKKYENYILEDQDLLMSHINSEKHLGKCAIYHKKDNEIIIHGMNLLGLRVKKEMILPKFAVYLFQTNKFKKSLSKIIKKSVNQASFAVNDLKKIKVDIPDIEQQQRIVSILDSCISLKRKRQSQITALDELTKSLFLEMFGDNIRSNYKKEKIEYLGDGTKYAIKAGPFGSALKKEFYVNKGYKIYGQEQVIRDNFSYGDYYIDEKKYQELINCSIKPGDILISLVGTFGKLSVVPDNFEPGIINPRLMKLSLDTNKINPHFFKYLMSLPTTLQQLAVNSHGGTMGIINVSIIKEFKIIVPPIDVQLIFINKMDKINKMKNKIQCSIDEMTNLYDSLIQKAFKGKLF